MDAEYIPENNCEPEIDVVRASVQAMKDKSYVRRDGQYLPTSAFWYFDYCCSCSVVLILPMPISAYTTIVHGHVMNTCNKQGSITSKRKPDSSWSFYDVGFACISRLYYRISDWLFLPCAVYGIEAKSNQLLRFDFSFILVGATPGGQHLPLLWDRSAASFSTISTWLGLQQKIIIFVLLIIVCSSKTPRRSGLVVHPSVWIVLLYLYL